MVQRAGTLVQTNCCYLYLAHVALVTMTHGTAHWYRRTVAACTWHTWVPFLLPALVGISEERVAACAGRNRNKGNDRHLWLSCHDLSPNDWSQNLCCALQCLFLRSVCPHADQGGRYGYDLDTLPAYCVALIAASNRAEDDRSVVSALMSL
jgi:hypothetical protein